jgi:bifunctional ADP-heptose synthase (sugar kinase/adenylyltransferase)
MKPPAPWQIRPLHVNMGRPHAYDYAVDTVVGAQEVQSWGGQVQIVPIVEGFSTTRLLERV